MLERTGFVVLGMNGPLSFFRAPSAACGSSQASGPIGAVSAGLHHSSWQLWIFYPLSKSRDRTRLLMDTSWVHYHGATKATPEPFSSCLLKLCAFCFLLASSIYFFFIGSFLSLYKRALKKGFLIPDSSAVTPMMLHLFKTEHNCFLLFFYPTHSSSYLTPISLPLRNCSCQGHQSLLQSQLSDQFFVLAYVNSGPHTAETPFFLKHIGFLIFSFPGFLPVSPWLFSPQLP